MKRIALRVLVFLLIGAVINVAVAWTLATKYIGWTETLWLQDEDAARRGWPVEVPASWGVPNIWAEHSGLGRSELSVISGAHLDGKYHPDAYTWSGEDVAIERAGWPLRTVKSARLGLFEGSSSLSGATTRYRFVSWRVGVIREEPSPGGGPQVTYVPVSPLWAGLAVNSAFYGLVTWSLTFGVIAAVRQQRLRRGLCPSCSYPAGTSPVCTECGKPVKPRSAVQA